MTLKPDRDLLLVDACQALQNGVYVKDLNGRYLMANTAAAAAVGLQPGQLVGKTDLEVLSEVGEPVRGGDQEVISRKGSHTAEEPVIVNGESRTYLSTEAPLKDRSGAVFGLIGVSTDITSLKAFEEELRQREARLLEAQRVAQVGSWEWNLVPNELRWSEELYRIFGVSRQIFDPTYDSVLNAVHPEDRERVSATVEESLKTGNDFEIEHRVVRPDGTVRTVIARATVFLDLDGEPLRMVGAALDITERKRIQVRPGSREALSDDSTNEPFRRDVLEDDDSVAIEDIAEALARDSQTGLRVALRTLGRVNDSFRSRILKGLNRAYPDSSALEEDVLALLGEPELALKLGMIELFASSNSLRALAALRTIAEDSDSEVVAKATAVLLRREDPEP